MPELPEVETIRRGLAGPLVGEKITDVIVDSPKQFFGDSTSLVGCKITDVQRRAKLLLIELDDNRALGIHLKMTGQLLWKGDKGEMVMGGHPEQGYIDTLLVHPF